MYLFFASSENATNGGEDLSASEMIEMSANIITAIQLGTINDVLNTTEELLVSVIEPLPSTNDSAWTIVSEVRVIPLGYSID